MAAENIAKMAITNASHKCWIMDIRGLAQVADEPILRRENFVQQQKSHQTAKSYATTTKCCFFSKKT